jgi:hypothetical protein
MKLREQEAPLHIAQKHSAKILKELKAKKIEREGQRQEDMVLKEQQERDAYRFQAIQEKPRGNLEKVEPVLKAAEAIQSIKLENISEIADYASAL